MARKRSQNCQDVAACLAIRYRSGKLGNGAATTRAVTDRSIKLTDAARWCRMLAVLLQISATLYSQGLDPEKIAVVLASLTVANWSAFDRTTQGAALAALCALAAPASEVALNALFGLWHYPHADFYGVVSWCARPTEVYVP
jgi:hypothetical protein